MENELPTIMKRYEVTLLDSKNNTFAVEVSTEQIDFEDGSYDDEFAINTAIQYLQEINNEPEGIFTLKQLHRIS